MDQNNKEFLSRVYSEHSDSLLELRENAQFDVDPKRAEKNGTIFTIDEEYVESPHVELFKNESVKEAIRLTFWSIPEM